MNKRIAVEMLNKQKIKLSQTNADLFYTWKIQTTTYIKEIFGEHSNEYLFINKFSQYIVYSDLSYDKQLDKKREELNQYLGNCIETLSHIHIYKPPKRNFLNRVDNKILVPIIIALAGGLWTLGFRIGQNSSDIKNIELKMENNNLKDSISIILRQPFGIPNKVSDKDTNSDKKDSTDNNGNHD